MSDVELLQAVKAARTTVPSRLMLEERRRKEAERKSLPSEVVPAPPPMEKLRAIRNFMLKAPPRRGRRAV